MALTALTNGSHPAKNTSQEEVDGNGPNGVD